MFDITVSDHTKPSRPSPSSSQPNSGSVRSGPNSGPHGSRSSKKSSSGPMTPLQVVTCGSIPLKSSFLTVAKCVYISTELYEYRGWGGKSAYPKHRFFSWGCRHVEKYVADFYVSNFQSGFRAQVKKQDGAKVAAFVKPTTIVDITKENRELSPSFLCWLTDCSLSSDDRIMRLKEGYIKEGSTVTVMGVCQTSR